MAPITSPDFCSSMPRASSRSKSAGPEACAPEYAGASTQKRKTRQGRRAIFSAAPSGWRTLSILAGHRTEGSISPKKTTGEDQASPAVQLPESRSTLEVVLQGELD